jgi:glyoxylase-like metal-dependent hydrolase (beta-lactamase superfamily II)
MLHLRTWIAIIGLYLCLGGAGRPAHAQPGNADLDVVRVRPNLYMIAGAGGNIAVQTGDDGAVLVDSGAEEASDRVIAAVKRITARPIRYIINTGADAEHVGGNGKVAKAGRSIFAMGPDPVGGEFAKVMTNGYAASILAAENVLIRMSAPTGQASPFPNDSWPTETFHENRRYIYFNREAIEILRQPAAHSDADSIVFFRASDVVAAGDVFDTTRFPAIDSKKGGSIQGEISALNRILDLAVRPMPLIFVEGGTLILPGHGRVSDQADLLEYRDMVVIVRDVVEDMLKRGMTLEQVKAAAPAKGYEPLYGSPNDFVESIYKGLAGK